jgi:hypothetical protein
MIYAGYEKCVQNFDRNLKRRPIGRPRLRWEDNIRIDLRETEEPG